MHENGQRLLTRQYRNNSDGEEVMVHSAEVEYYSFLQAGALFVPTNDSVTIQVGGILRVRIPQRLETITITTFRFLLCVQLLVVISDDRIELS